MKEKIKTIVIGILIGIIAFPSITLGGTFVVSLIQGKTVEEAIQILAEQVDALIGRVEVLEVKQSKTELWQQKEEICKYADELNRSVPPTQWESGRGGIMGGAFRNCHEVESMMTEYPYRPGMLGGVMYDTVDKIYNWQKDCPNNQDFKDVIEPAHNEYLQAKQECDELTAQYNSLNQ